MIRISSLPLLDYILFASVVVIKCAFQQSDGRDYESVSQEEVLEWFADLLL